jgi:hypothetical protein
VALAPKEAERKAKSVMTGGDMVGGAALGAGIGVAVGGPVGVEVGAPWVPLQPPWVAPLLAAWRARRHWPMPMRRPPTPYACTSRTAAAAVGWW